MSGARHVKRRHVVRQRRTRASQPPLQPAHLVDTPLDLQREVYLRPDQAARYLNLSLDALQAHMRRGTVPAWTYGRVGGLVRFVRASLDEFVQRQDATAALKDRQGPLKVVGGSHGRPR